ncbi:MAG: UDP-3-O-acylglucosamine N-acyltransferase [Verrucomicrobiaceae bacterium]|nr:UDP-3-O-acylglucosamine N-acyltransferase [Verrucomicrobiaceae bacterium]
MAAVCISLHPTLMPRTTLTLQALATLVGGLLVQGDAGAEITGLNSLSEAVEGDVSFLGNPRYKPQLKTTRASAILVTPGLVDTPEGKALIEVDNPTLAFSAVIKFFGPEPRPLVMGIHPSAVVSVSARLDPTKVSVGPHAVIEDEAVVGDGSIIHAGAYIGYAAQLGTNCVIHANAVIKEHCLLGQRVIIHSGAVIGSDGFGYELVQGRHQKIEQLGIVQIDDDVEVGSCTSIDRARFGRTHIGAGTKIDNLVQIGHNVATGQNCILVSQTGISGSTRLGNYVVMGGQVGVAGHLEIADQVTLLAKSGVTKNLPSPGAYTGYPAKPLIEGRKMLTYPGRVPELLERVKELERKLADLDGRAVAEPEQA